MEALKIREIELAVRGSLVWGGAAVEIGGVSTDSRTISPGELFIPLSGPRFDGHDYLQEAFAKGAAAALVGRGRWPTLATKLPRGNQSVLVVEDTLSALHDLARYYRTRFDIRVIAVTGSVGKTTTKDMIAAVMSAASRVRKSLENHNNEIGVPMTVLGLERSHQVLVLEFGMRGIGQIRALSQVALPSIGVVTNVYGVHLELLGSMDSIARAKGELPEALPAEGTAVLNADDPWVSAMASRTRARTVTFGVSPGSDVRLGDPRSSDEGGTEVELAWHGEIRVLRVPVPGAHNALNAAAAAATAFSCGLGWEEVQKGLSGFQPPPMRMQVSPGPGGLTVINDAYNASPPSVSAALAALRDMPTKGRSVAVLGDMLELGPEAEAAHREIGRLAASCAHLLVAVGPLARHIAQGARDAGMPGSRVWHLEDVSQAAGVVLDLVDSGDTVLVKASRAVKLERVAEALQDRKAVPADRSES